MTLTELSRLVDYCCCGMPLREQEGSPEPHSSAWHRKHLVRHVAAYPGCDERTRRNLAHFVTLAELLEGRIAQDRIDNPSHYGSAP